MAISAKKYRDRIVSGSIIRTVLWLGLPLMVVQVVQISYNIADAFWLSRYSDIAMAVPRQVWSSLYVLWRTIDGSFFC